MSEIFTFEVVVHCAQGYAGSIDDLMYKIGTALKTVGGVDEVEIALTARESV